MNSTPTGDEHDPLTPSEANPEVKRLRLLSRRSKAESAPAEVPAKPERRHRQEGPPRRGTAIPIALVVLIVGGAIVALLLIIARDQGAFDDKPAPTPTTTRPQPSSGTTSRTRAVINGEGLEVASARLVKPLVELEKGDRVLYQDQLCTWKDWHAGITQSTITCGELTFDTETAKLTPVELR